MERKSITYREAIDILNREMQCKQNLLEDRCKHTLGCDDCQYYYTVEDSNSALRKIVPLVDMALIIAEKDEYGQ